MITVNLTIIVEMVLFLLFVAVATKLVWGPLMNVVHKRNDTIQGDHEYATRSLSEAERLREEYRSQLSETDQRAARQIYDATYNAHRERRNLISELKAKADAELSAHRESLQKEVTEQRKRFPELLPTLIEEMDRQVRTGGNLL